MAPLHRACIIALSAAVAAARVGDKWGTNIHFTSAPAYELGNLSAAFKIARMDLTWGAIELTKGVYDFSAYDQLVQQLLSVGVTPYFIFDYFNPLYDGGQPPFLPDGIDAFAAFATAAVKRYIGKGIIWEEFNEPNGGWFWKNPNGTNYAQLAVATGTSIKAIAPGETYIGPACAGFDYPWLTSVFANGALEVFDAVSMHPYRPGGPETVLSDYAQLRALIAQYATPGKANMPIISGEWGYNTCNRTVCGTGGDNAALTDQAKYLARMWLTNAAAGVELSIYYDWKNDGTNTSYTEDNFGSIYTPNPFSPKPSYEAALALQTTLGNSDAIIGRVGVNVLPGPGPAATPNDVFSVAFTGPTPSTSSYGVWTNVTMCTAPSSRVDCGYDGITEAECAHRGCCFDEFDTTMVPQCYFGLPPVQVSFPVNGSAAQCFNAVDYLGQANGTRCASAGVLTVTVTDSPLYLLPA